MLGSDQGVGLSISLVQGLMFIPTTARLSSVWMQSFVELCFQPGKSRGKVRTPPIPLISLSPSRQPIIHVSGNL